jgi:hypothetical protein
VEEVRVPASQEQRGLECDLDWSEDSCIHDGESQLWELMASLRVSARAHRKGRKQLSSEETKRNPDFRHVPSAIQACLEYPSLLPLPPTPPLCLPWFWSLPEVKDFLIAFSHAEGSSTKPLFLES